MAFRPSRPKSSSANSRLRFKHGALNNHNGGKISVKWNISGADGSRHVDFEWVEKSSNGKHDVPAREGFGMELFKRILPYDLSASTNVDFKATGMRFTMQLPLHHVRVDGADN